MLCAHLYMYIHSLHVYMLTMNSDVILNLEGASSLASLEEGVGLHLGGVAHINTIHLQYPITSFQDTMPIAKIFA